MARNKKPRNKKYSGSKETAQSNNLQPSAVLEQANLTPEQIQAEEILFSLLERKVEIPVEAFEGKHLFIACLLYTSPSPRD